MSAPTTRRQWEPTCSVGHRWDHYRIGMDITTMLLLRDHLAGLDVAEGDDLYELFIALDDEVRTIPPVNVAAVQA